MNAVEGGIQDGWNHQAFLEADVTTPVLSVLIGGDKLEHSAWPLCFGGIVDLMRTIFLVWKVHLAKPQLVPETAQSSQRFSRGHILVIPAQEV